MNLIFDFDGTLVDSFECALEKFNVLADEFKYKKISRDEIGTLKNLSSKDFVKKLKIPFYKIPHVIMKARQLVRDEVPNLPSFASLPEVLHKLFQHNVKLGILTSNSYENVEAWLKRQNLRNLFSFIHNEANYFGKAHILKKIIKQNKFAKDKTFYIGDETRDIEAAKKSGIFSVAVTWGFNNEEVLRTQNPDFILSEPNEIFSLIN